MLPETKAGADVVISLVDASCTKRVGTLTVACTRYEEKVPNEKAYDQALRSVRLEKQFAKKSSDRDVASKYATAYPRLVEINVTHNLPSSPITTHIALVFLGDSSLCNSAQATA